MPNSARAVARMRKAPIVTVAPIMPAIAGERCLSSEGVVVVLEELLWSSSIASQNSVMASQDTHQSDRSLRENVAMPSTKSFQVMSVSEFPRPNNGYERRGAVSSVPLRKRKRTQSSSTPGKGLERLRFPDESVEG